MDLVKSKLFFSGVESKFGVSIGKIEWSDDESLWSLTGLDGKILGQFKGIVASDKSIVSPRITEVTGRMPPLGMDMISFFFFLFVHLILRETM